MTTLAVVAVAVMVGALAGHLMGLAARRDIFRRTKAHDKGKEKGR